MHFSLDALAVPAVLSLLALLAGIALFISGDGGHPQPPARHRVTGEPPTAPPPSPAPEEASAEPVKYGILDPQVSLAEVEEYLRQIGITNWNPMVAA